MICPDDVLINVPFAALPLAGRPLIERFVPCLVPEWRWSTRPPRSDSNYREGLGVAVTSSKAEPNAPRLENAESELNRVANAACRGVHRLRRPATAQETVDNLQTCDFAHFACHGVFQPASPMRSGLLLTDKWLRIDELAQVRAKRLDRVVLASCWSASTTILPGREFISLPATFLRIGARSVVASLWRVEDPASPHFMEQLYGAFGAGDTPQALAQVQKAWWNDREPTRRWACFTVWIDGLPTGSWLLRLALRWLGRGRGPRPNATTNISN